MRKGILTLGTGLAHGFVRTRPGLEGPDVQCFFMHASYANAAERILDRLPGMTIGLTQLRPESRGTIHAVSPDPMAAPSIRPNFLATGRASGHGRRHEDRTPHRRSIANGSVPRHGIGSGSGLPDGR